MLTISQIQTDQNQITQAAIPQTQCRDTRIEADIRVAAVAVIEAVVVIEAVAVEAVEATTVGDLFALCRQIEETKEDKDTVVVAILMAVRNSFPISTHTLTIS